MPQIADINDNEFWITETTLMERYGKKRDIQVVDTDIRLYSYEDENDELAPCVVSILQTGQS